jgi:hypothetical protein
MIVHFIASEFDIIKDIETLRNIVGVLHKHEYSLARDWIEPAYARRLKNEAFRPDDWSSVYQESLEAIAKSDVVIAEASNESFSLGYQVSYAMQQKKPILLLHKKNAVKDVFAQGLTGTYVLHKEYDDETELDEMISQFLEDNRLDNKDLRFNFFIDRQIYNYLRWASFRTGKTKAEILREMVQREIKEKDY